MAVKQRPRAGDLFLSAGGTDAQLGSEGYRLVIGDRVEITAGGATGVFYGTQTVLQMLRSMPGQRTLPRGEARDWPRFRERGYMLDAGRKYWSPDYVVQTIREMAYLKLNTLQLHLSDNNAFRLVSDRFPYLAAPEAYTRADIRRFEAAARKYHVTIIPEIEMPAHAGAILAVRPDLGLDCLTFGTTLDVTRREVRDFTSALIDEFAPLFSGPEFHIATDEYPGAFHQGICEPLVRYADERGFGSTADVFVDFINEMNRVVRSHGKRTVIWNWWNVNQSPATAPDKNINIPQFSTTWATDDASIRRHGRMESFLNLESAPPMSAADAEARGDFILSRYRRASFAGPFVLHYGQLQTTGGHSVNLAAEQARTCCKLILTDYGYGGEVIPGAPQIVTGSYSYDVDSGTATLTPLQHLHTDFSSLMSVITATRGRGAGDWQRR